MSSDSGNQSVTTILYTAQISNDLCPSTRPINGKRILSIELEPRSSQFPGSFDYPHERDTSPSVVQNIIKKIEQIVGQDRQLVPSERIDSVRIGPTDEKEPTKQMFQALGGLSLNHLTIHAGWNEEANFAELDVLQRQWTNLQTLCVEGLCQHIDDSNELPTIFSQISSLTLNYCCNFNFIPPGGTTNLKHFRIQENDAFHMFMMTFDGNPGIAASLEVLDVESMDGNDFAQASELEDRFKRCPNLRELRLAVGHHYGLDANLASCIPSSVEKLDLKFSRSLPFLQSFDDWIDRAKDSSWLPHLASFHMSIDAKSKVAESQTYNPPLPDVAQTPIPQISVESFDVAFKTKRMALYDLLKSTRPKIHLTY